MPAYFTDAQRQATKDAGAIAGLDVLRILNARFRLCVSENFAERFFSLSLSDKILFKFHVLFFL